ncbi:hypothetical protein BZA70DRAFT_277874 [Myxozyma melibiosi]|uniref:VPS37 C-terminal domain-containing protein n=1 Tax=Myxozyma melibiosi TaxID=54550 RepID=A0ABR1F675_9ASCO
MAHPSPSPYYSLLATQQQSNAPPPLPPFPGSPQQQHHQQHQQQGLQPGLPPLSAPSYSVGGSGASSMPLQYTASTMLPQGNAQYQQSTVAPPEYHNLPQVQQRKPVAVAPASPAIPRRQQTPQSPQSPRRVGAGADGSPLGGVGGGAGGQFVPASLKDKSRGDLAQLLEDDAVLTAYFEATHPASVSHREAVETLAGKIAASGTRINAKEETLSSRRTTVEKQLREAQKQDDVWHAREKEMYAALQPYSSSGLKARLSAATAEAEQVSEALAGSFLDMSGSSSRGGLDAGQFVRDYRQVRKIFHLRKERLERWKEERVGGASVRR